MGAQDHRGRAIWRETIHIVTLPASLTPENLNGKIGCAAAIVRLDKPYGLPQVVPPIVTTCRKGDDHL